MVAKSDSRSNDSAAVDVVVGDEEESGFKKDITAIKRDDTSPV